MAAPPNISDNGMLFSKPRTIIREEIDLSNSIDELFNSVHNPGSAKPLKERKLPPSFFHPTSHQNIKSAAVNHSRDSSSDSTSGVCSPPLQIKHALQTDNTAMCSNDNATLMLQYIGHSHLIAHSRAHSSPATLQASLQKGSTSVTSDLCTPLSLAVPTSVMPMVYNKKILSYDNKSPCTTPGKVKIEEMNIHHQHMQSSPATTTVNIWNSLNESNMYKDMAQTPTSQETQR